MIETSDLTDVVTNIVCVDGPYEGSIVRNTQRDPILFYHCFGNWAVYTRTDSSYARFLGVATSERKARQGRLRFKSNFALKKLRSQGEGAQND